jgi:phosphoribosylformylglycinamidine cyclo-ligase
VDADCALLGGETAIMPDLYQPGHYDLAGFCVGVVERRQVIDGRSIADGDLVLGLASSGLHSNGYSLVRKVVFELAHYQTDTFVPELGNTVADELLRPTQIYARLVRQILRHYKVKNVVHGVAHITGGGLIENLQRIVPAGVDVEIERGSWTVPPVFPWLQQLGQIDQAEMERVFNMGLGLVMIVSPYFAGTMQRAAADHGIDCFPIGRTVKGQGLVRWAN